MDESNHDDGKVKRKRRNVRRGILYGILGAGAEGALLAARPIAAAVQGEGRGWHGLHGRWGHGQAARLLRLLVLICFLLKRPQLLAEVLQVARTGLW